MVCEHLRELYELCQTHQLRLGGADLIRIVCKQCNRHDVCPSTIHEDRDEDDEPLVEAIAPLPKQSTGA